MQTRNIKYTFDGNTAIITFNRTAVLNSFNKEMGKEVQRVLLQSEEDNEIRAIMLTGEGKAFCAGQDLSEAAPENKPLADLGGIIRETYNPIVKLIRSIEKPVVAAVNGVAAGAGANIALACDIIVASERASFIQAFSKIGLIPDSGGTFFLPRLIGFQKASALIMLGDKLTAADALSIGLVYKTYPDEHFFEEAVLLTKKLAGMPTKALGLIKRALNNSFNNNLDEQLALEEKLQIEAGASEDYKEGIKAFLEKRSPKFKGR